jgi:DNA (cytosine-5)-methyltransferase 1
MKDQGYPTAPEMVSLFTGLGGLDLGLERAGWRSLYATDIDVAAVESLLANQQRGFSRGGDRFLADAVIEQADVRHLNGGDVLSKIGRRRGDLTLLAGGPPCQSWSSAGHQRGFEDPRGQLIREYLRVSSELDCRYLLFENVRGLLTARGADGAPGSALAWLRHELFRRGWQSKVELLNAADFGVAQRRVRLIILGYRAGDDPDLPSATHAKTAAPKRLPWRSLGDCLSDIAPPQPSETIRPSGKLAKELANIPPGSGVKSPGKPETTRPGGHWGYKQGAFVADLSLPARTITANSQQDWVRDPDLGLRRLSPRECAAIQGFPSGWIIAGNRSDQYRLIGNAVPPDLAFVVGQALLRCSNAPTKQVGGHWPVLAPLPERLQSAIEYTRREESRNGESRRAAAARRRSREVA